VVEGRYLRNCVRRRLAFPRLALGLLALGACSAPQDVAQARAVRARGRGAESTPQDRSAPASAGLDQCVTSVLEAERSATFSGEMTTIPGTWRMAMRIEVQERLPGETAFHTITAPGLGVWRASEVKVKVYRYFKQVTNLHSPAAYRALVRFRWLGARGHVLRHVGRLTPRCLQPASPAPPPPSPEGTSTSTPPASG
jgi:hypothetical protein